AQRTRPRAVSRSRTSRTSPRSGVKTCAGAPAQSSTLTSTRSASSARRSQSRVEPSSRVSPKSGSRCQPAMLILLFASHRAPWIAGRACAPSISTSSSQPSRGAGSPAVHREPSAGGSSWASLPIRLSLRRWWLETSASIPWPIRPSMRPAVLETRLIPVSSGELLGRDPGGAATAAVEQAAWDRQGTQPPERRPEQQPGFDLRDQRPQLLALVRLQRPAPDAEPARQRAEPTQLAPVEPPEMAPGEQRDVARQQQPADREALPQLLRGAPEDQGHESTLPAARTFILGCPGPIPFRPPGDVAEWLRSGLQSRLHRFDS